MGSVIAILLMTSHILHFASPFLSFGSENPIPRNPDNMTATDFVEFMVYYESYNWTEYNADDFPDWLYMPEEYLDVDFLNQSEDSSIPPFWDYDWENYNADDFPAWILAPDTLNSTWVDYIEEAEDTNQTGLIGLMFMIEYMDPTFLSEINSYMDDPGTWEGGNALGEIAVIPILSSMFIINEAIFALVWLVVAIILFIISRSVD